MDFNTLSLGCSLSTAIISLVNSAVVSSNPVCGKVLSTPDFLIDKDC